MEDKEKLFSYLHRPEDEQLARRILDYIEAALKHKTLQASDFLNPHEQKLACQLVNQFLELHYILDGGIEPSEQKIILIGPDFMDLKGEEKVNLYKGSWSGTFSHRDILGSVLSLGVQRKKIGDIFFTEDAFYIAVKAELGNFLEFNLSKIKRNKISLEKVSSSEVSRPKPHYEQKDVTVSSERLDAVISEFYNLSRKQTAQLLQRERVKLNYCPETKASVLLNRKDLVSVRKKGRFIYDGILSKTKKGRYRVRILYQK